MVPPGAGAMPRSNPSAVEATCKSATAGTPTGGTKSELAAAGTGAALAGNREGSARCATAGWAAMTTPTTKPHTLPRQSIYTVPYRRRDAGAVKQGIALNKLHSKGSSHAIVRELQVRGRHERHPPDKHHWRGSARHRSRPADLADRQSHAEPGLCRSLRAGDP